MEQPKLISEFNEAAFQIQRLHNIWLACGIAKTKRKLDDYEKELDKAEDELNEDAEKKDNKENNFGGRLIKLNKDIKKYKNINFINSYNISNYYPKDKAIFYKIRGILYSKLREKERLLRKIQETAGKGGKYFDWEEEGMD